MAKRIALLSYCLLLFDGCSERTPNYLPLSDHSRWESTMEFSSPGLGFQRGKGVIRVDGHEIINGKDYRKVVAVVTGIPGYESFSVYRRHTPAAEYEIDAKHKNDAAYECIVLPLPPKVGNRWETDTPETHTVYKIEAVETAELPDRKYEKCLKISYGALDKTSPGGALSFGYQYLAPGIGNVKEFDQNGETKITFTLDKHTD